MHKRRVLSLLVLFFLVSVLSRLTPVAGENSLVTFTAKLTIKTGKEQEFETTMKAIVPQVRQEPGNRAYTMCRSKENPRLFLFFEEYVDQAAIEAHRQHLKELGVDLATFLDGAPVLEFYEKLAS
ncbi:MAG: antibiotic biosynthesis monooxygenase [Deltaproteobacteria bacterium]|nr:antibiotic biosynthesis monooxygenase [Deltaproteobacteria bacterium]